MTASAFSSPNFDLLVGSNAPRPVQKAESEKTCTLAVSMLQIGPPSNRWFFCSTCVRHSPEHASFFVAQKNWFSVLLIFKRTPRQDVQHVLRIWDTVILTTSDASLDWSAHVEWCPHTITCENKYHVAVFTQNLEENIFSYKKNYPWRKQRFEKFRHTKYTRDGRDEESSRITSRRILCSKIERKSWDNTKAQFTIAGNVRADEFYGWFRAISIIGVESQWEIVLNFQSTSNDSKFSFLAQPRQTFATWRMEYVWNTGKRFLVIYLQLDELKSSRSVAGKQFSKLWHVGCEDCFCFE